VEGFIFPETTYNLLDTMAGTDALRCMKKTFRHEGNSFILDVQTRAGEYKISLLDMETEEAKSLRSAHQFRFLDGERFELHTPDRIIEGSYHFTETDFFLHLDGKNLHFQPISSDAALSDSDLTYTSPMPGKLIHLPVSAGDSVEEGQTLFVVEAMKMENQVKARRAGIVESVNGKEGDLVNPEDIIITLES
tara:strand:- start:66209 stop:66784 length:576 start_codon:yes stop_codon:yes gene_type:complete